MTAYDLSASDNVSAITTTNQGQAAPTTDNSEGEVSENIPNTQPTAEKAKPKAKAKPDEIVADTPDARLATEATVRVLTDSGIEVVEVSDAMAMAVMGDNVELSAKKKRALETASVQEEHQPTVVSSADGTKVLNNLDNLANEYSEKSNQSRTFLGDIAKAIGAERKGSGSEYVTFETKNGKVVTIRLSNHNAKVSNFDNNGETDGISIVVSAKGNAGITNDGEAHIVEHYYDAIRLRRAEGKPLADIVRSIKQALYSGEFTDTTGLAERQEVNLNETEALRTPRGTIYGWTDGRRIYLTREGMNPETPIHEYTHLWARAMMQHNAPGWQSVKDLLRDTPVWQKVLNDPNYAGIHGNEDAVASEVIARLSGNSGAQKMQAMARRLINEGNPDATTLIDRIRQALQEFWNWVGTNLFGIKSFDSIDQVTDRVLWDMLNGTDLGYLAPNQNELMILGEQGASALDKAEEVTHRMDNLKVAREMEAEGKDAKTIRMATGWERGADGKWRYETEDFVLNEKTTNRITNELDYQGLSVVFLGDLIGDTEIFNAYPQLRNLRVRVHDFGGVIPQGALHWEEQLYDSYIKVNKSTIVNDFAERAMNRYAQADSRLIRINQGRNPETGEKFADADEQKEYKDMYSEMAEEALADARKFRERALTTAKSVLLHEVQHAIQFIEGFAIGSSAERFADVRGEVLRSINFMTSGDLLNGSAISDSQSLRDALSKKIPYTDVSLKEGYADNLQKVARKYGYDNIDALVDDFENMPSAFEQYHRTAGEVESRNVQSRMGYTEQQRRETLLAETEDVAREAQIFIMENSDASQMSSTEIDINPLLNVVKILYERGKEFASKLFQRSFFDVAKTPDFMKPLGLRGDKFTVRYGVISRHAGKDGAHDLSLDNWAQLPQALQTPFAICRLNDSADSYRIYTTLQNANGEYIVVGVDVKNVGRELNVNAISTAFGRRNEANLPMDEEVIYKDKNITPEQSSLLERPNFAQYPTEQELSTDKVSETSSPVQESGELFRPETGEPFYSNAEYAVLNIRQEKATPQQWLAMIQKNGGLKSGEDKWIGLSDWLSNNDAKTLTKQEVLEFISQNQIVIEEVRYSQFGAGFIDEATKKLDAELKEIGWDEMEKRYPGFGEYFEMYGNELVWSEERASIGEHEDFILDNKILTPDVNDNAINETRERYTTEGLENKKEIALVVPTISPYNERDEVHFGDAGGGRAVAWVRFGETTDANGNRILVIDEIQSKRHQDGREKGYSDIDAREKLVNAVNVYRSVTQEYDTYRERLKEKYDYNSFEGSSFDKSKRLTNSLTKEERANLAELNAKQREAADVLDKARDNAKGVPDAPFDKNWHELAMKRMLRYAAENGFDKVAWTTGEQQAKRYDIGTSVNHIHVINREEERYVSVSPNNGRIIELPTEPDSDVIVSGEYKGQRLQDVFGKELAEKILSVGIGEDVRIAGEDLHIGGEGMKGFYDKMLPSFMNKYGKKWGVKVGEVTMPDLQDGYQTMHSVDVTPQMRESVMQGQPMFRPDDIETVNEQFNAELDAFDNGTLQGELHLGQPGPILQSSGLNASEMFITPRTLKQHLSKHGLTTSDIRNLPEAMQEPLMVYEWGTKAKSLVVITQIPRGDQRITVAVKLERGGNRLEVNEIASVHGKDAERFISEMINSKEGGLSEALRYVDKINALDWLGLVPPKGTASLTNQEREIANIIENFDNPTIWQDNNAFRPSIVQSERQSPATAVSAEQMAERLGISIEIDESMPARGSYNPRTGRIRINPSRHSTAEDVQRTVLHEAIGHGGIHAVTGKHFERVCTQVYDMMTPEQRVDIRRRHGNLSNEAVGAEYMADTGIYSLRFFSFCQ